MAFPLQCGMVDLPVELIMKIVSFVIPRGVMGEREGKADLCNLRLVSTYFNDVVSPILFHRLTLRFKDAAWSPTPETPDSSRCYDIIMALATRATRVFDHTKVLDFSASPLWSASCSANLDDGVRKDIVENIFSAVSSLRKLHTVSWSFDSALEPESLAQDFVHALGTIPSLRAVERFAFPGGLTPSITLKPISDLASLRVTWNGRTDHLINEISSLLARCPNMGNLVVDAPYLYGDGTTFDEIFAEVRSQGLTLPMKRLELNGIHLTSCDVVNNIRQFRRIEFMGISRNPSPLGDTVFGEVCTTLKEKEIFLKGVYTDFPEDPLLLEYLTSYSGLEELLFDPRPEATDCSDELVEGFYTQVLPAHSKTLEHLKFTCWPIPTPPHADRPALDTLVEVGKCRKLRTLEIRYPGDGLRKDPGNFGGWLEVCGQLQDLVNLNIYSYLEPTICDTLQRFRQENGKKFLVWGW